MNVVHASNYSLKGPGVFYSAILSSLAFAALIIAYSMLGNWEFRVEDVVLVVLFGLAQWVRIGIEPSGHVTLGPLVLFAAVLTNREHAALVGALLAPPVVGRFLQSRTWARSIFETGEEVLAASVLLIFVGGRGGYLAERRLEPYLIGLIAYASLKLLLGAVNAFLSSGVRVSSFFRTSARYLILHNVFLAAAAVGVTMLYARVGFLVVPLATVALIEFYYPAKLISEQREVSFASLAMIAQAIDAKDPYTALHSRNVSEIAVRIARAIGLSEDEVRKIRIGALLHDIGKIGVSGRIIRKPSQLTDAEQAAMREHPVVSANIMRPVELLADAAELVRHHHEHYDGSGYPDGLRGEAIPLGSRVILVADAFDAMTTDRPYRRGRSREEALKVLRDHAGRQFDDRVVDALSTILQSF